MIKSILSLVVILLSAGFAMLSVKPMYYSAEASRET